MRTAAPVGVVDAVGDAGADRRAHRLGVLGGRRAPGADRPDRLVGDDQRGHLGRAAPGRARRRPGRGPCPPCAPASRSSSVSPTHTIGVIRWRMTAVDLAGDDLVGLAEQLAALAVAADDVGDVELGEERRRDLAGERALVLPVAVLGAERPVELVADDERLHRPQVGERRVDADVDTPPARPTAARYLSFSTKRIASKWSWCIFQLPEISGRRALIEPRRVPQGGQPGEVAELEQFERRAAAGGHVVDVVGEPELGERRRRVAAADDGERLGVGDGLGQGARAGGEAGVLEHAHRAVPEHGAGVHHDVAELGRRARTDVEALGAGRQAGAEGGEVAGRRRGRRCRSAGGSPWWSRRAGGGRCRSGRARAASRRSELPWAARNVKHIAPPMASASTVSRRASMTPSLSLTLAPPSTATNGRLGSLRMPEEHLDLAGEQATHRRRDVAGRTDDRGVGAVRRTEGVVDVAVDALDEAAHEGVVVALLARVEAQVLEQLDAGGELGQAGAYRVHGVLRVGRALGPAEVAGRDDAGAALLQPLQRRQGGADAEVVGDLAAGERHVEVGADEDPLAVERPEARLEVLEGRDAVDHLAAARRDAAADLLAGVEHEVDHPVGVAPLVVVPAEHLDELAHRHRQLGVEDARVRVALDVAGHDRVLGVADDALERSGLGGLGEGGVDVGDAGLGLRGWR